jgi:DNA-binding CsgD family transcriptional regulator
MTASRLARARELLGSHTITEIAAKLGVSRRTLYAHMRQVRDVEGSV